MKHLYSALYPDDCFPFSLLDSVQSHSTVVTPDDIKDPNSALVIWGGSDIHPNYYKHPMHSKTYPGGRRDAAEWSLMQTAIEKGIPIIGVCRGAQMLCAAAGGWLIQDVRNHVGGHKVTAYDGSTFHVNSIHHQMMAGLGTVDHTLLAWREGRAGAPYLYKKDEEYHPPAEFLEPEFVYFKKIKGYAIQWHPESMPEHSEATKFILNFIKENECECAI